MKVDFRHIEIENINEEKEVVDIAKVFGNAIFPQATNFEEYTLAKKIWKDGEVELTDADVEIVKKYTTQVFPSYVLQQGIINAMK